jgi:hypothetical protein
MFYLYKKRKKENLGIGEERILSFGAAHLLTLFDGEDCLFFFFPIGRKAKQFSSVPPIPRQIGFICYDCRNRFIYFFHLQWPQLKCEKEEKSTGKRKISA